MAIKKIFAIFDEKSDAFLQPFFSVTVGQATRNISDAFDDPQHIFSKHTLDFTLYSLGTFNETTGFINPETKQIAPIKDFKKEENNLHSITGDL